MSEDVSWPPTSPKAALLSSPSGRKRYSEAMHSSPIKRSRTTPNLLSRLQEARDDPHDESERIQSDEDDEETLKLQLAAIEAKLKLKKLQQSKARPGPSQRTREETVQVGLSPVKRSAPPPEPRSPGRVLLGIDKGKTGADISLKRAKSVSDRSATTFTRPERSLSRVSQLSSRLQNVSAAPKSFSERMAEVRDKDKGRETKRNAAQDARVSSFDLDKSEMDGYRALAEEARKKMPPPASRSARTESFTRDEVLQAKANGDAGTKMSRSRTESSLSATRRSGSVQSSPSEPDSSLFEGFSGINLSTRILPHSFLKRTLPEDRFAVYTVPDLLRDVKSPEYEMPDEVGDYVVFAIIASKSSPLDQKVKTDETTSGTNDWERKWDDGSKNQRKFIAMTLTDLKWTVDLYLFGTAVPRYHRLSPGTVIAILNPSIMPPKKGKEDTGAFSLTLGTGDDTVLEIGTASELGYCNAKKKDGSECGQWVNIAKTEICEWHLNMQLYKAEQDRMSINNGSNGFGRGARHGKDDIGLSEGQKIALRRTNSTYDSRRNGMRSGEGKGGLLPNKTGQQFNKYTGESFYVSKSSAPATRPQSSIGNPFSNINTARKLDLDDPFVSEGQLARDRKSLLNKRKERESQEMQIAKQLGKSNGSGAGAEYMRHRTGTATKKDAGREFGSRASGESIKGSIMRDPSSTSTAQSTSGLKRRTGNDVRLSPVKKTRFVTDRGIREAGRESLGVPTTKTSNDLDDDDDDDLDIV